MLRINWEPRVQETIRLLTSGMLPMAPFAVARLPVFRTAPTTQVVVHYAVPEGQRYLPITLNNAVTMSHIGRHNGDYVYEPISTWLQSPGDGLRYHRSMNEDDV